MNMTPQLKETQELISNVMNQLKDVSDAITQLYLQKRKEEILSCIEDLKHANDMIEQAVQFTYFGQKSGGQRSTAKKTKAVRENGKKGGRPSNKIVMDISRNKDDSAWIVTFNDTTKRRIPGKNIQDVRDTLPPTRYKWDPTMETYYNQMK